MVNVLSVMMRVQTDGTQKLSADYESRRILICFLTSQKSSEILCFLYHVMRTIISM